MAKTGTVYIPEGVEIIPMGTLGSYDGGETSYKASHDFDKVVIPYTVTTIQEQAFVSNSKLTEITFLDAPDGRYVFTDGNFRRGYFGRLYQDYGY